MFALAEIKGDWPFLRKILRFVPSFTGNRVCHHCKATVFQHDHPFEDFDSMGRTNAFEFILLIGVLWLLSSLKAF